MDLRIDVTKSGIEKDEIKKYFSKAENAMEKLWSGKEEFTGWVKLPLQVDKDELEHILNTAITIQEQCEELIVIGVGGSYLGARAMIHALVGFDDVYGTGMPSDRYPKIKFAGHNLSATYLSELLEDIRTKEVNLCVISKSGTTMEPSLSFAILKDALLKKCGKEKGNKKIYAITDSENGTLREEAIAESYVSFNIPKNIGGRFSVLTPVGLLPLAVAGIDIKELLAGAESMATSTDWDFEATDYAITRYKLYEMGKKLEVFEYYEPQLEYFVEWLKQLFGESEGKDGKGIFPAGLQFSTDLHSMGQFLQDGSQIFFETILNIVKPCKDIIIPIGAGEDLEGLSMNYVNRIAMEGVMVAHENIGIPMIKIDIPELNAFYLGQLIYFFETSSAISAYLMEVNPFDQPGVECYKQEIVQKIKKATRG